METIQLKIVGESDLLHHSDRLLDPMDNLSIAKSELTSVKTKTPEIHRAIQSIELEGACYFDSVIGVHLPSANLRKSFVEGARLSKQGKTIERGFFIVEEKLKLAYKKGDASLDDIKTDPHFKYARGVVQTGKRIIRARPIFRDWSCVATVQYDDTIIKSSAALLKLCNAAGRYVGVCDWRMGKGGRFGSYTVALA